MLKTWAQIIAGPKLTLRSSEHAMYVAAQRGHLQIVELLVKAGIDIDKATSKTGTTPLHIATKRCHIEVVRLLIDSDADIYRARTVYAATPLQIAAQNQRNIWVMHRIS